MPQGLQKYVSVGGSEVDMKDGIITWQQTLYGIITSCSFLDVLLSLCFGALQMAFVLYLECNI